MNMSKIISFPSKVKSHLREMKAGTYDVNIDHVEVDMKKSKVEIFVDFVVDPEKFHYERELRKTAASSEYQMRLHDAMNPTSFEVADPIPASSNVCDCQDVNDVDICAKNTVTITNTFIGYTMANNIEVLTMSKENHRVIAYCNAKVYDTEKPIKIVFPENIVFEAMYCKTCGTRIGWCTEIGGRGFKVTPDEFIKGLFTEQINKILEEKI